MVVATVAVTIVTVCSWFSFVVDCTFVETPMVSSFTPSSPAATAGVTTEPLTVMAFAEGIEIFAETFPVAWLPVSSQEDEEIEGRDLLDCESDIFLAVKSFIQVE